MGNHIVDGEFQSDKYPTTPRGKVPLSVKDATAQDLLWQYAQRRRAVDAEFADDLEIALKSAGYPPPEFASVRGDRMTYRELKAELDKLTPAQLARPVVWSGDERGGYVKHVWVAAEDEIGEPGDHETWCPRSEAMKIDPAAYADAAVCIAAGTVHLMVD